MMTEITHQQGFYEKYIKRLLDLICALLALIVLSPVMLITAIGIKLSSPGPVLYFSYRNGRNKVPFCFYKFRSMHTAIGNDKGLCVADEDRVFPWGRIIRRLKIDELPQLLNVIKGDMSIVGPRPMASDSIDDFYSGKYEIINTIKPGLTSVASLYDYTVGETYTDESAYREIIIPMKLEMELMYVHNQSCSYDINLVFRTIITILAVFIGAKSLPKQPEVDEVKKSLAEMSQLSDRI